MTAPLIAFVHVPKTAGSSVNHHLRQWGRGQDHCEKFLSHPDRLRQRLDRLDWVSGHVALNKFQSLLDPSRSPRWFGAMRDPARQVASHYNWLIEIAHRGPRFYWRHPKPFRDLSRQIRRADSTNPDVVIEILRNNAPVFMNLQSRFLLGDDIDLESEAATERVSQYEHIFVIPPLDPAIRAMTGRAPTSDAQINASPTHIDLTVFNTPAVHAFLSQANQHDIALYHKIRSLASKHV